MGGQSPSSLASSSSSSSSPSSPSSSPPMPDTRVAKKTHRALPTLPQGLTGHSFRSPRQVAPLRPVVKAPCCKTNALQWDNNSECINQVYVKAVNKHDQN